MQRSQMLDGHDQTTAAIDDHIDVRALLQHLAVTRGITPETVASLLLHCQSERLRNAILMEIMHTW